MRHLNEIELVMALDGELEPDELKCAVEHLAECEGCRNEWEKLQATSERVVEYQRALYPEKPFAADERGLTKIETPKVFSFPAWSWGLVAALVVLAVTIIYQSNRQKSVPTQVASSRTANVVEPQNARSFGAKSAPQDDAATNKLNTGSKSAKRHSNSGLKAAKHTLREYTELPFSDASLPLTDATVVRVKLPAAALRQAGVPVEDDSANSMLQADVVLGLDGLPRGIRLVKNAVASTGNAGTN